MQTISMALIDDDALIVELLGEFLGNKDSIEIQFKANSGEQFLNYLEECDQRPQVIVMDLKMGGINGAEVTSILKTKYPEISTIIMSSHYKKSFMGFMLKTGVSAFIPKGVAPKQLFEIIVEVANKGFFFLPDQLEILREQVSNKSPKPILDEKNRISERELEVLQLICNQYTAQEIADKLFIAKRTAEGHKNTLFVKTGAKNIAGLVIYAIQNNLVNMDDIPLI